MNGSFQGLLMPQSHWISLRSPFGRNTHSNHMIGAAMCFAHKLVQTHIQDQHLLLLSCVLMREVKTQRTGHGIRGYLPIGKLLSPVKDSMPFVCWMLYSAVPISQYWTNHLYIFPSFPSVRPLVHVCSIKTVGPRGSIFDVSIYITYISVSKSTPLSVTGPHGQLASYIFPGFPGVFSTPSCHSHWTYGLEYYIHFGQYIHPIGSDRPLWAAGE